MNSRIRSLSGAALMLVLIPIFAGLLACMPVPIGNPERSKVDPDITGIWAVLETEESDTDMGFYVFEPYDKRTWLITGFGLAEGDQFDADQYDFSTYKGYENLAASEKVHAEHVYSDGVIMYKAWITKLAGQRFFTWEPKGVAESLGEDPEYWMVQQIFVHDENTMILRMVNGEAEQFDDIDKTRRAYERVLKKNVNDPEIYGGPDDEYRITLVRAEGAVLTFFEEVAAYVIGS